MEPSTRIALLALAAALLSLPSTAAAPSLYAGPAHVYDCGLGDAPCAWVYPVHNGPATPGATVRIAVEDAANDRAPAFYRSFGEGRSSEPVRFCGLAIAEVPTWATSVAVNLPFSSYELHSWCGATSTTTVGTVTVREA